jgi:putative ABC transport system permease protein
MSNQQQGVSYIPEGLELPPERPSLSIFGSTVDPGYFDTMRVPIVKGRAFAETDGASSPRVAIVNEEVARKYWPGQDAVGKRLRLHGPDGPWLEVVGVARTHRYIWVGEPPSEYVYLPLAQTERQQMTLLLESHGDPALLAGPLRELARSLDPNVPMHNVRTMEELFFLRAVSLSTMLIQTVAAMGALGLLLAVMGLYALMAYSVGRRTREIGIRMAIGAGRRPVLGMVLKQGLALASAGVAVGLLASVAVVRLLAAAMSGVSSSDPVVLVALPLAVVGVTLVATLVPARRAALVDPVKALRYE